METSVNKIGQLGIKDEQTHRYYLQGRKDFLAGVSRNGWKKLVPTLKGKETLEPTSWWLKHWFYGPPLNAWLLGWEEEAHVARIRES